MSDGTVAEALLPLVKSHLRIDENHEDLLLLVLINAAISTYQSLTGKSVARDSVHETLPVSEDGSVVLSTAAAIGSSVQVAFGRTIHTVRMGPESPVLKLSRTVLGVFGCVPAEVTVYYETGWSSEELPATLVLGVLRYVAFAYEHRGDDQALIVTRAADVVELSGAISVWKPDIRMVL